jgi:hypothetical protein
MRRNIWDDPEQSGTSKYWKTSRREERAGKILKRKDSGNKEKMRVFPETCIEQKQH